MSKRYRRCQRIAQFSLPATDAVIGELWCAAIKCCCHHCCCFPISPLAQAWILTGLIRSEKSIWQASQDNASVWLTHCCHRQAYLGPTGQLGNQAHPLEVFQTYEKRHIKLKFPRIEGSSPAPHEEHHLPSATCLLVWFGWATQSSRGKLVKSSAFHTKQHNQG